MFRSRKNQRRSGSQNTKPAAAQTADSTCQTLEDRQLLCGNPVAAEAPSHSPETNNVSDNSNAVRQQAVREAPLRNADLQPTAVSTGAATDLLDTYFQRFAEADAADTAERIDRSGGLTLPIPLPPDSGQDTLIIPGVASTPGIAGTDDNGTQQPGQTTDGVGGPEHGNATGGGRNVEVTGPVTGAANDDPARLFNDPVNGPVIILPPSGVDPLFPPCMPIPPVPEFGGIYVPGLPGSQPIQGFDPLFPLGGNQPITPELPGPLGGKSMPLPIPPGPTGMGLMLQGLTMDGGSQVPQSPPSILTD
ncbi:MAG: hypothetical protein RIK87_05600 [Fuerstiella sp.]